jgi:hypothetical protein
MDCFWGGHRMLWRITGCFDARYDAHECGTGNVVCARRGDPWHGVLDGISRRAEAVSDLSWVGLGGEGWRLGDD